MCLSLFPFIFSRITSVLSNLKIADKPSLLYRASDYLHHLQPMFTSMKYI